MSIPFRRALVTGGAGFIGSHIVEHLVANGVDTVSVDDYSAGKKENLSHLRDHAHLRELTCDISDRASLERCFEGVDVVFHNAASKKTVCLRDPRRDLRVNAEGAFNLLELSVTRGVKKFVHASTGSVYGEGRVFPQTEEHPLAPVSYYGVSKLAGERYAEVFWRLHGLDVTILRYFHVYGPRQEYSDVGGVVSIFIRNVLRGEPIRIFGDGEQQRSFTYVADVVAANMAVAARAETAGQVYNCASGVNVTINELATKVKEALGRPDAVVRHDDWVPGDIRNFQISNTKIRRLGLAFSTDFDTGLRRTVEWARRYFGRSS